MGSSNRNLKIYVKNVSPWNIGGWSIYWIIYTYCDELQFFTLGGENDQLKKIHLKNAVRFPRSSYEIMWIESL